MAMQLNRSYDSRVHFILVSILLIDIAFDRCVRSKHFLNLYKNEIELPPPDSQQWTHVSIAIGRMKGLTNPHTFIRQYFLPLSSSA